MRMQNVRCYVVTCLRMDLPLLAAGQYKVLSGQHSAAAIKLMYDSLKKAGLRDDSIHRSFAFVEAEVYRVGMPKLLCRLAAGLGQAGQESHGLSVTEILIYMYYQVTQKKMAVGSSFLTDREAWFHLSAAGLNTKDRRDKFLKTRAGQLRSDEEVDAALVCYPSALCS